MQLKRNKMVYTPQADDKDVQKLLELLESDLELLELAIEPEQGAKISDCTEVVRRKVEKDGGRIIYGWQIWKSSFLIEAEFHAVWEMPDGETLKDITPKPPGFDHILFLEDENLVYKDQQIDSIRLNISKNVLVDHFIAAAEAMFRIKNRGERANLQDEEFLNSLSESDVKEIENHYSLQSGLELLILEGKGTGAACFCGSNKKYKDCHGENFMELMSGIN